MGYLGDNGAAVAKEAEFRGELKGEVGERRRGLASRSPLCSFHSSSSFSMDSRLLTFDSFCSVCCSMACSLDSCLQGETESRETGKDLSKGEPLVYSFHAPAERLMGSDHDRRTRDV